MRIVSLAPSNTEILYALGCQDDVVAVTNFCNYPQAALQKPRVGGWVDVNDDLVKQYTPDVVMTSSFVQDHVAIRYRDSGIQLFHTDPNTLEQVYESIISIGQLVGKVSDAEQIVNKMKTGFAEVAEQVDWPTVKVYAEEWHNPPMACGNWVPAVIKIAGGDTICNEGEISRPVTSQEVRSYAPDCIVLSLCGLGSKVMPSMVAKRGEDWQALRPVRNNKVFVLNDSFLNRPGPRLVEGARQLVSIFQKL